LNIIQKFVYFLLSPQKLLLVDAVGAAVTAFATYFLLAAERLETGIPTWLLQLLAIVALSFVSFDVVALNRRIDPAVSLRVIAGLNLSYCMIVLASLYVCRRVVTELGWAYFCVEIIIVISLATLELKLAAQAVAS
jgi:hypothetical protein